jgi:RsiW-degrading membrane proteinase PrsW (M82 family)
MLRYHESTVKREILCVLWGALGACTLSAIAEVMLISFVHINFYTVIKYWAPVIEEIFKAVYIVLLLKNIRYRSITAGIVYGGLIGIGFAYIENIIFILAGTALEYRLLTGMTHIICTGLFGGIFAYVLIYQPTKIRRWSFLGISASIVLHMSINTAGYPTVRYRLYTADILLQMLGFIGLIAVLHSKEQQILESNLKKELEKNIISQKEYRTFLLQINKFPYFRYYNQIFLCGARLSIMAHYQKINNRSFYGREVLVKRINLYRKLYGVSR